MSEQVTYGTTGKSHPYHIVNPSPWPLLCSFAAGGVALVAAMAMHGTVAGYWVIAAFAALFTFAGLWFRDIINEASTQKVHSTVVKLGFRYGMLLFIASEVMFFVAFFWAFFNASLAPTEAIGGIWPPASIKTIDPFDLPFMMTMILLLSGCTITWSHAALIEGNRKDMLRGLLLTVILGAIFTGFQLFEYHHASFGFKDTVFASTFYMATGFHGFHVLIGTIFLLVTYFRARKDHFKSDDHFGFEAAAWYWHFVDVVWLFLFVAVYWYGG
jgi:cytochrome c oxidase subunit 3